MKRTAMTLITALCFAAAVLHLVSGQVRPIFNANSYMGSEGGTIIGNLVISGLSGEETIRSGSLLYEIEAFRDESVTDRALATYDNDYAFQSGANTTEVTFSPDRDASSSFTINLRKDDLHEGDEFFFLRFRFKAATGDFDGAFEYLDSATNQRQECIITDDDVVVCELDSLAANISCANDQYCLVVNEGAVTSVIITSFCRGRFERSIEIEVNCQSVSNSEVEEATVGADFIFTSFSFTYPASDSNISNISRATQELVVSIINDNEAEPREQFVCDLLLGAGALVSTENQRITVNIDDDDSIKVSWRQLNYTFFENEPAEVEMNASDIFSGVNTIPTIAKEIDLVFAGNHPNLTNFTSAGIGRATVIFSDVKYEVAFAGRDFEADQVSFIFSDSDSSKHSFKINKDGICEPDEIFAADILRVEGFNVTVVQPNTTFIIIKDADVAQVGFNVAEIVDVDIDDIVNFTLITNATSSQNIVVDIHCSSINSAVTNSSNGFRIRTTIVRGQNISRPLMFNIGDVLREGSNCLLCNITGIDGPPCAQLGRNPMKVCVVPRTVTIDNETVIEGGKANITLHLSQPRDEDCNVTVQTTDGTAAAPGDYTSDLYTVVIPAGSTTAVLMVQTHLDGMVELPENFTATIIDVCDRYVPGNPSTSYVEILDSDRPQCFFSQATYSVTEGDVVNVTILTSSDQYNFPFTVTLSYMDGSAVQDEDYTPQTITVAFAPGDSSRTFEVPTIQDELVEKLENFQILKVNTSEPDRVSPGSPDTVTVNIVDDDILTVMFSPDDYEVSEAEVATVTLVTNLAYTFDFSVTVVCESGSASTPEDFAGGEYTATFTASPSETGRSSVQIQTFNDSVFEDLEFFNCILRIPAMDMDNVVRGNPDVARVNITDTTGADCFFDPDVYLVDEGQVATLCVNTSVTVAKRFSCIVTTSDDSATSPSDYQSGVKMAIFEVGSSTAKVNYSTVQDDVREGLETFRATLNVSEAMQAMGVRVGNPNSAVVDIRDDEVLFVMFNQTMYVVTEGDPPGDVLVSVTLIANRECEDEYTVNVIASDGTALEGMDYRGQSFPVRFPPFTTSASFLIPIVSDFIAEPDEVFTLQLEAPQNADGQCRDVRLGNPDRANVEIKNDDIPVISLNVSSECYEEKNGTITIPILASLNASFEYTVTISTRDGTAEASTDYIGKTMDVTFPPYTSMNTTMIELRDDNCVESEEQFFIDVSLSRDAVDKGVQLSSESYQVKICDNDAEISFEKEIYNTAEGNTTSLTFITAGDLSEGFEVTLARKRTSTADEGDDYTIGSGRIVVVVGATNVGVNFMAICDDEVEEGTEFADLEITVPPEYQHRVKPVNITMARVNIRDVCPTVTKPPERSNVTVNDSVIADPLYTVPMRTHNMTDEFYRFPLCYEVHGKADRYFNLVSDDCASVNAYYAAAEKMCGGNVIRQIGVVAEDNADQCHRIQVDVTEDGECITQVDNTSISSKYDSGKIMVIPGTKYVFIAVPNCQEQPLIMWVRCQKPTIHCPITEPFEQPMIKFVVSRGLETRSEAHGLIGQFWGVPFNITRYTGPLTEHAKNHSTNYYTLRFDAVNANQRRTFTAKLGKKTWTLNGVPSLPGYKCFYAGNSQGGPSAEALDSAVQDSVIEGEYSNYMTTGLFVTDWSFGRYTRAPC